MFTVPWGVSKIETFEMLLAVLKIGLAVWLFNSWWIPKIENQSCLFELFFTPDVHSSMGDIKIEMCLKCYITI